MSLNKKSTRPIVKVVFDTSVIHSQLSYQILRNEVIELIQQHSLHSDINFCWFLPEIVIDERRHQMLKKSYELLVPLDKIEKLLGHGLGITSDILKDHVNKAIDKQLEEYQIEPISINIGSVDWHDIIQRSVQRHPPFDPGNKEKGFRDAIVAQSFMQLVDQSPSTPKICRMLFVSHDKILRDYVESISSNRKNVRVMSDISELESLINTFASKVTEEFVAEIQPKASNYFFEKENETGLYYKEKIRERIEKEYANQLISTLNQDLIRENGTWWISPPVFVNKTRQTILWFTPIQVDFKLYRIEYIRPNPINPYFPESNLNPSLGLIPNQGFLSTFRPATVDVAATGALLGSSYSNLVNPSTNKIKVSEGKTKFEVNWSVKYTQNKRFTSPKILEIKYIDTK